MRHKEWIEKCDIHALGALDGVELAEFQAHLNCGCDLCEARLDETRETLMLLHRLLPLATPPASIKECLLNRASFSSQGGQRRV